MLTWRKLTGLAIALAVVAVLQPSHDAKGGPSIAGDIHTFASGSSAVVLSPMLGEHVTPSILTGGILAPACVYLTERG